MKKLIVFILLPCLCWAATAFDLDIVARYVENNAPAEMDSLRVQVQRTAGTDVLDYYTANVDSTYDTVITVDSLDEYDIIYTYYGVIGSTYETVTGKRSGHRYQYDSVMYAWFGAGTTPLTANVVEIDDNATAADNLELMTDGDSATGARLSLNQLWIKNTMAAGSHGFYIEADNGGAAYWMSDHSSGAAFTAYSSASANGTAFLALASGSGSDGMRAIGTGRAVDFSAGTGIYGDLEGTVDGVDVPVEAYVLGDTLKTLLEYVDGISDSMDEASQTGAGNLTANEADTLLAQMQRVADSVDAQDWAAVGGAGSGPDTLELYVLSSADSSAIAGATVSYFEGATKHVARTNSSGLVTFGVTAGTYTCQAEDGHWYFAQEAIASPGIDTIFGTAPVVTGAGSPDEATVYGQIHVDGEAANRNWVEIELTRADSLTVSDIYVSFKKKYWTDSTGLWQAELYYLTGDTASFYYRYEDQTGRELFFRPVDTTTVNINDVLIPKP